MRKSIDNVNHRGGTAADDGVLELVHSLMHQYRARQYQVLRDGPHALTHMESKVLAYFARHAGATQSELAQHSGRDKAQLARLITGLRERGLLAGQADDSDRRNLRLSLTPDGQSVQRTLARQALRLNALAVTGLSQAEHQQLRALLLRVKDNLETRA
jgi:DNA-binding MarR family transcriptional regulator